jgi:hypothetical protein
MEVIRMDGIRSKLRLAVGAAVVVSLVALAGLLGRGGLTADAHHLPGHQLSEVNRDVSPGWNFVTALVLPQEGQDSIADLFSSIEGKYSIVWQFDNAAKSWYSYDPSPEVPDAVNDLLSRDPVARWEVFQIYVTQAGTWTLEGWGDEGS